MTTHEADAWFDAAPEEQRAPLRALRAAIKAIAPDAAEAIKWSRPCYATARGPFCYLHTTRAYAQLGFENGTALDDPEGLLEGTGRNMRHVNLRPGDARRSAGAPAILALLRQAAAL